MKINLSEIWLDESLQVRAEMNPATVAEYTERMTEGESFPPIIVWQNDGANMLIDGYHRYQAMKDAGFVECEATQFAGSKADALIAASLANRNHGLPMTRADKRKAIKRILDAAPDMSSRSVAEAVGVSDHTVAAVRDESGDRANTRLKGKDGRLRAAKMARKPRGEAEDRDEGEEDTPPDPGMGGDALAPDRLADAGGITRDQAVEKLDKLIGWSAKNCPDEVTADLMAVKAYVARRGLA